MSQKHKIAAMWIVVMAIAVIALPVCADDEYKPYLHEAVVPEHPELQLYGSYSTSLYPGAGTYSYAIQVPKGTNGLTPDVSLSYNSQQVKQRPGVVGAGWSLSENYILRHVNYTPSNTSNDEFRLLLNGNLHELVYDGTDGYYHTKIESYLRIEKLTGASNNYSTYWRVTSRDGIRYRFGHNNDSELTSNQNHNYTLKWSLDRIIDVYNNTIEYTYNESPYANDTGAVYLYEIVYNQDELRKVSFVYEDSIRPDRRRVYAQGNLLEESRRLDKIDVYADNNLVRRYSLEYANLNPALSTISAIKQYGSDGASLLYQASFEYHSSDTGYTNHSSQWIPPVVFSNTAHEDYGVRLVDFNNDGYVDLLKGRDLTNEKEAWINNKNDNWTLSSQWAPPLYFVNINGSDTGIRFADINNDGLIDMIQASYVGGPIRSAYLNDGSGWSDASSTWDLPLTVDFSFGGWGKDMGTRIVDLNGDGWPDIIQSEESNVDNNALMNNGSGWTDVSSEWVAPVYTADFGKDRGVRIVDLNGDGLPDIIKASNISSEHQYGWLNNGSGWVLSDTWTPSVFFTMETKADNGARLADINGDGLPDLLWDYQNDTGANKSAWINNGNGWTFNNSWVAPEPFTDSGNNIGRRLADIDGNGATDMIVAYGNGSKEHQHTLTRNVSSPYLLKKITHEYGGKTYINYTTSTTYNHTNASGISQLGFNIWVVQEVLTNNSLTGSFENFANSSYNYTNGSYDYDDLEFRGFALVKEFLPDNSTVQHFFHQDDEKKGKEYLTEIYDSSMNIYSSTAKHYTSAGTRYFNISLDSEESYLYDGIATNPKIMNVSYIYDQYGNIIFRDIHGDTAVSGDEKYEHYSYVSNTDDWIIKLSRYSLYESDNTTLAKETEYAYDERDFGETPDKGALTRTREWNDNGEDPIITYEHDGFGNVIREFDPLGHETKYIYGLRDATFTYPDRITNALGHRTDYLYDLRTGNLLWEEKDNIRTSYYYDLYFCSFL